MNRRSGDTLVVGAGIIGLAVARALLHRRPGSAVVVVDKEATAASHQTAHNSGVVHSGVYYRPGSAKAELCVRGARQMLDYCRSRSLPARSSGKVIVAVGEDELPALAELRRRAVANGVPDVRSLGPGDIASIEPEAAGIAGLHVPGTAVVDFGQVARCLLAEVVDLGARVELGFQVSSLGREDKSVMATAKDGRTERVARAVACAGLQSDRLFQRKQEKLDNDQGQKLRIVPFRGSYFHLEPGAAAKVRSMIYPVPDPRFPFLGVHFTRHVDDAVSCGPNAVLALSRERYQRWAFDPRDAWDTLSFGGFWRLARHYWATGATEILNDLLQRRYLSAAKRYLPALEANDLRPGPLGIRAQAVEQGGRLVDDFALRIDGPILHVLNAPSPAATASLAIAERIADLMG